MRLPRLFAAVLSLAVAVTGFGKPPPSTPWQCEPGSATAGRRIAYYDASNVHERKCDQVVPSQIHTTGLTHLILSSAVLDPKNYSIVLADPVDAAIYNQLLTPWQDDDVEKWIELGFGSDADISRETWAALSSTAEGRQAFVGHVLKFLQQWGFQGIHIDWDWSHNMHQRLMMLPGQDDLLETIALLRSSLGDKYGLSLSLPVRESYLLYMKPETFQHHVDWFNLVSYDLHGSWEKTVIKAHSDIAEVRAALAFTFASNVQPDKINLGISNYGRGFTAKNTTCVRKGCEYISGSKAGTYTDQEGFLSGCEIQHIIHDQNLTSVNASAESKELIWGDQWISYDDAETLAARLAFADSHCLGGTSLWAVDRNFCRARNSNFHGRDEHSGSASQKVEVISQLSDGQLYVPAPPTETPQIITQISDGQVQAPPPPSTSSQSPQIVTQISDGQPQSPPPRPFPTSIPRPLPSSSRTLTQIIQTTSHLYAAPSVVSSFYAIPAPSVFPSNFGTSWIPAPSAGSSQDLSSPFQVPSAASSSLLMISQSSVASGISSQTSLSSTTTESQTVFPTSAMSKSSQPDTSETSEQMTPSTSDGSQSSQSPMISPSQQTTLFTSDGSQSSLYFMNSTPEQTALPTSQPSPVSLSPSGDTAQASASVAPDHSNSVSSSSSTNASVTMSTLSVLYTVSQQPSTWWSPTVIGSSTSWKPIEVSQAPTVSYSTTVIGSATSVTMTTSASANVTTSNVLDDWTYSTSGTSTTWYPRRPIMPTATRYIPTVVNGTTYARSPVFDWESATPTATSTVISYIRGDPASPTTIYNFLWGVPVIATSSQSSTSSTYDDGRWRRVTIAPTATSYTDIAVGTITSRKYDFFFSGTSPEQTSWIPRFIDGKTIWWPIFFVHSQTPSGTPTESWTFSTPTSDFPWPTEKPDDSDDHDFPKPHPNKPGDSSSSDDDPDCVPNDCVKECVVQRAIAFVAFKRPICLCKPKKCSDNKKPKPSTKPEANHHGKCKLFGCGCGWMGLGFGPGCPEDFIFVPLFNPCGLFGCNPCGLFGCPPGTGPPDGPLGHEGYCLVEGGCDPCPPEICPTNVPQCTQPWGCGPRPGLPTTPPKPVDPPKPDDPNPPKPIDPNHPNDPNDPNDPSDPHNPNNPTDPNDPQPTNLKPPGTVPAGQPTPGSPTTPFPSVRPTDCDPKDYTKVTDRFVFCTEGFAVSAVPESLRTPLTSSTLLSSLCMTVFEATMTVCPGQLVDNFETTTQTATSTMSNSGPVCTRAALSLDDDEGSNDPGLFLSSFASNTTVFASKTSSLASWMTSSSFFVSPTVSFNSSSALATSSVASWTPSSSMVSSAVSSKDSSKPSLKSSSSVLASSSQTSSAKPTDIPTPTKTSHSPVQTDRPLDRKGKWSVSIEMSIEGDKSDFKWILKDPNFQEAARGSQSGDRPGPIFDRIATDNVPMERMMLYSISVKVTDKLDYHKARVYFSINKPVDKCAYDDGKTCQPNFTTGTQDGQFSFKQETCAEHCASREDAPLGDKDLWCQGFDEAPWKLVDGKLRRIFRCGFKGF